MLSSSLKRVDCVPMVSMRSFFLIAQLLREWSLARKSVNHNVQMTVMNLTDHNRSVLNVFVVCLFRRFVLEVVLLVFCMQHLLEITNNLIMYSL